MAAADLLFEVRTPLGFSVTVTRARWELIATTKHPVMRGRESSVRLGLESPDEVRQSRGDAQVLLFYRCCSSIRRRRRDAGCAPLRSGPAVGRSS